MKIAVADVPGELTARQIDFDAETTKKQARRDVQEGFGRL